MPGPEPLRAADVAACRAVLRRNSRTFHAASLLLPARVRAPASVLYGFCRVADDTVDLHGGRGPAIAALRARLDAAYAGAPQERALGAVLRGHGIPRLVPEMLLEGLAWDAEGRRYATREALFDYAARVAGTVGAMMALLMGARSPQSLARACDLGVAMQLTNIARDVGEDARAGRLYLPLDALRAAGLEPEDFLAAPRFGPALAGVVRELLQVADGLYRRAGAGIARLPVDCRPGIEAARRMYAAIGDEVLRHGGDSVTRRAVVPRGRQLRLLARSLVAAPWPSAAALAQPPLAANQALVEASAAEPLPPSSHGLGAVIELFERLERRDRAPLPLVARGGP
ncbi:phytoene/squalene synthase family protein [Piscinibacter sakaiensis]|uniref:Phytoene synthase n=1 Tax=Piscinibacter sakaiensis TaxID=1547922 RepID=A0A0K8NVJ7_PISS1|nr:phytoene/squalene synthase family protein [Piscinibacter sakaiensis]GAP34403.1 phytoene synthase [Piscinibacter sakaiensis]